MDIYRKFFISESQEQTIAQGSTIGSALEGGSIICLYGDLGSGKTLLTKGIAKGLSIDEKYVKSPSYTLINQYIGKYEMFHMDLYRLDDPVMELEEIGYRDFFYGKGVSIIEWADKILSLLPHVRLDITLKYVDEEKRSIEMIGRGEIFKNIV